MNVVAFSPRSRQDEHAEFHRNQASDGMPSLRIGTWDWDILWDSVRFCEMTAALFGFGPHQAADPLPLKPLVEAIYPNDRQRFSDMIRAACETGGSFHA